MNKLWTLVAIFAVFSSNAQANTLNKYTYNFGLGATIPTGSTFIKDNTDVGPALRFGIYKFTKQRLSWGLDYDYLDFSDDTELNNHSFTLNARYHARPFYKRLLPFAKLGAGLAIVSGMPTLNETRRAATMKLGLGATMAIDTHWALGIEGSYHYIAKKSFNYTEQHIIVPTLNLTYAPGKNKNNFYYKQHKHTTWANGDQDQDGVLNMNDHCKDTPTDVVVNRFGCQAHEKIEFALDVKFVKGSYELDKSYANDIAALASIMNKHHDINVVIEGHTDSDGDAKYNDYISKKRAESVQNELVNKYGIAVERLKAVGFGESKPIADNITIAGKQKNRRVVAEIKLNKALKK